MAILELVQKVMRTSIKVVVCTQHIEKHDSWITILITVLVKSVNFGMSGNREIQLRKSTFKQKENLKKLIIRLNMEQKAIYLLKLNGGTTRS